MTSEWRMSSAPDEGGSRRCETITTSSSSPSSGSASPARQAPSARNVVAGVRLDRRIRVDDAERSSSAAPRSPSPRGARAWRRRGASGRPRRRAPPGISSVVSAVPCRNCRTRTTSSSVGQRDDVHPVRSLEDGDVVRLPGPRRADAVPPDRKTLKSTGRRRARDDRTPALQAPTLLRRVPKPVMMYEPLFAVPLQR